MSLAIITVLDEGDIAAQVVCNEGDAGRVLEELHDAQQRAVDNDLADNDVPLTFEVGGCDDLAVVIGQIEKGEL
jgi:ArsR family metal-binding transcriptional regulator